jgi:predicted AlkP superfamily phosphohydrolase/phosphomutase
VLEDNGVDCRVIRMPSNFPPTDSPAKTLSGLGTPDVHGSYGIFSFFTSAKGEKARDVSGGRIEKVRVKNGLVESALRGPENTFDVHGRSVELPFRVFVDPLSPAVKVSVQGREFILQEGEWSDWLQLRFPMMSLVADVPVICRFHLRRVRPDFELYVSPLNIDPTNPFLPISTPPSYARRLAQEAGLFYTQGMPQDTRALSAGVFSDDEYRQQAVYCLDEERRLFRNEFAKFREGFFFSYFGSLDMNSHMFWRTTDPGHPLYSADLARRQGDFLPWLYGQMDAVVGEALQAADDRTTLIVVSDHGFGSFRRQFNLNGWLMDNGYAKARDPLARGEQEYFGDVKWPETRAYGLGINALYLNLKGREPEGCVPAGAAQHALTDELAQSLMAVRDPQTNEPVIRRAYRPSEIYSGPYVAEAPDLIIGYNTNYRASWDTILGKYPRQQILDNTDPWSGDHAMDSSFMPGVFFCNRTMNAGQPALSDMAPTILSQFGVPVPREMSGKTVGIG